jgi:hypothetical protein
MNTAVVHSIDGGSVACLVVRVCIAWWLERYSQSLDPVHKTTWSFFVASLLSFLGSWQLCSFLHLVLHFQSFENFVLGVESVPPHSL